MESKVEFVACDFPQANRLTLHILAAVAQHEVEMIRTRTKAAMQAAKARGVKFGNPMLENGLNAKQRAEAKEFAVKLAPMLQSLKASGMTLDEMCHSLTRSNVPTPRGGMWSRKQLSRIFHRLEESEAA